MFLKIFPSIQSVIKTALDSFVKFPFVLTMAIAGTIISIYTVDLHNYTVHHKLNNLYNLIIVCGLGISFLFSLELLSKVNMLNNKARILLQIVGIIVLGLYYITLPKNEILSQYIRFYLLFLASHLWVAFVLFMRRGTINGFWQFNKSLFLRFLLSALYSSVLYIGLFVAVLATDKLFSLNINYKIYFKLWIFIVGIFNTWFFLSGISINFDDYQKNENYPNGLKIFTQFILLPLVTIYLLILYCYSGKILYLWELPVGWVSYLVLCFSVVGIFSLLLIYPVKDKAENGWIRTYEKIFYLALFPLVILLTIAISRRIQDYGITENRYFVVVLAAWLLFIAFYFLVSKQKNIKLIPITLFILAILTSFGPWGAISVSQKHQLKRFESIVTQYGLLKNETISKNAALIPFNDLKNLSSIVNYLTDFHGYNIFQPYFKDKLDTVFNDSLGYYYSKPQKIMELMGLKYISKWETDSMYNVFFSAKPVDIIDIDGFSYLSHINTSLYYDTSIFTQNFTAFNNSFKIHISNTDYRIKLFENDSMITSINIPQFITKLQSISSDTYNSMIDYKEMQFDFTTDSLKIKLNISSINGNIKNNNTFIINAIEGDLLLGKVNKQSDLPNVESQNMPF